jgi:hypothetical protein
MRCECECGWCCCYDYDYEGPSIPVGNPIYTGKSIIVDGAVDASEDITRLAFKLALGELKPEDLNGLPFREHQPPTWLEELADD